MSVRAIVEAALHGRDERLLARCDVVGIISVLEDDWCIFDVDTLAASLSSSFVELQTALRSVAAPSFLGLLKAPRAPPHVRHRECLAQMDRRRQD